MKKKHLKESFNTVFNEILYIQNTIDSTEDLRCSLSKINFDNVKETEELITRTKDKITKLQDQINKVDIFFTKICKNSIVGCEVENDSGLSSVDNNKSTKDGGDSNSTNEANKNECAIQSDAINPLSDSAVEEIKSTENVENSRNENDSINESDSINENVSINESDSINENDSVNESECRKENTTKTFLKCIDIKMLMKPDLSIPEAIVITSDSENENDDSNINKRKSSSKMDKKPSSTHNRKEIKNKELDSYKKQDYEICNKSSRASKRIQSNTLIRQNKFKIILKKRSSVVDSSSDSHFDDVRTKTSTQVKRKSVSFCRNLQDFDERYFKSYVPLPRIPCEKLKEVCLKDNELNEGTRRAKTNFKELNNSLPKKSSLRPKSKQKKNNEPAVLNSSSSEKEDNLLSKEKSNSESKTDQGNKTSSTSSEIEDNSDKEPIEKSPENLEQNTSESSVLNDKNTKSSDQEMEKTSSSSGSKKQDSSKKDNTSDSDSDSGSDFETFNKKKVEKEKTLKPRSSKMKKRIIDSESDGDSDAKNKDDDFKVTNNKDSSSSSEDSEKDESSKDEEDPEPKSNKRKRIKRMSDSSDEGTTTRKTIRKLIAHESLTETTKKAEKEEQERKARIAERQKKYNAIFEEDQPIDAVVDKLVLDFNEKTKKEIITVDKKLTQKLKPHQAKGVQFMWDACFESVERIKSTNGSGCILAHCMGLGKTLQVITLVHALLSNEDETGIKNVLVVAPLNTVLNWVAEFTKWLNDIEPEIEVFELVTSKQNVARQYQVEHWTKHGGVLIIGYDMFRNLTNTASKRLRKSMRIVFEKGFVDPGPDLIICDEGHLLKNEKSNLSIAMNKIHTKRRIVLTGTPMQNNLKEYYCMVQFVKPNLLGTYKEYLNRFVNPITNGQYTDSTDHDITIMRRRSHVLHKMLDGVIQRKDYSVLMPYLPPKYEYVLFLTLTDVQIQLYQHYLTEYARRPVDSNRMRTTFLFTDFQEFQRICTHPRVLLNKSIEVDRKAMFANSESESEGSIKDFINDDSDEAENTKSDSTSNSGSDSSSDDKPKKVPQKRLTRNAASEAGIDIEEEVQQNQHEQFVQDKWWSKYCSGPELDNIGLSSKLHLLFEILQQCELIGDKLLVFSQSLYSLNIIEYFLARVDEATQNGDSDSANNFKGSWSLGLDYFRLDGSSSCDNRSIWCKHFNNPNNTRARLFLISTRAGGIGINLTGANRVIIFDVSWNPSHDIQSIYRVYRFGQTKPCYIYRFVTNGTMEMKVYERQVTKQAISKRVIDEQQIDRHYNQNDLAELYNFDPKPEGQPTPLVPKDVLLAELIQKEKGRIFKYHEHQTLLENKEDEELNEAERKAAWEEYESEKTARVNMGTGMGWIKNVPISAITAALYSILSKDNPSWTNDQIQAVVPLLIKQLQDQVAAGDILLFNRVLNEIKLMQTQIQNQQRFQNMLFQQQVQALQQRYTLNPAANARGPISFPSSSEIVELND